jgi:hypothetical protein
VERSSAADFPLKLMAGAVKRIMIDVAGRQSDGDARGPDGGGCQRRPEEATESRRKKWVF